MIEEIEFPNGYAQAGVRTAMKLDFDLPSNTVDPKKSGSNGSRFSPAIMGLFYWT